MDFFGFSWAIYFENHSYIYVQQFRVRLDTTDGATSKKMLMWDG